MAWDDPAFALGEYEYIVGIVVASIAGAHPFYGLLIGSVSFVGGPGTTAAWAKEALGPSPKASPGFNKAVVSNAIKFTVGRSGCHSSGRVLVRSLLL